MPRRRRLLVHLYLLHVGTLAFALAVATWFACGHMRTFYLERSAGEVRAHAQLAEKALENGALDKDLARVNELCRQLGAATGTRITAILPDGRVVGDSFADPASMENHAERPEVLQALALRDGFSQRWSITLDQEMMYAARPIVSGGRVVGVVRSARSIATVRRTLRGLYIEISLFGVVITGVVAAVGYGLSRRMNRTLVEIRKGAERFANGDLDSRLEVPNSEELGSLADAMNRMAARLDDRMGAVIRQRNELEAVLSSMVEGVLAVDIDERVLSLNQSAARLLRVDPAAAPHRLIQELVRNPSLHAFVARALASAEPVTDEVLIADEEERRLRARGTTLKDENGRKIGALIVLDDVTRIRRLETVRRDFVANVSHELKTPITSIKGFVETLLDGAVDDPAEARRFLRIVHRQADRLGAIIEDLLVLSRIEQEAEKSAVPLQAARVRDVLQAAIQACETSAAEKGMHLDLVCPNDLEALLNAPLLEQAVVNLIDNAIKYSATGSVVRIEGEGLAGEVVIRVRDAGAGISREHLPRLFERFYRVDKSRSAKLGGTGLGLAIVKHIAQAHQGRVTVESTPGKGSVFSVQLPKPGR